MFVFFFSVRQRWCRFAIWASGLQLNKRCIGLDYNNRCFGLSLMGYEPMIYIINGASINGISIEIKTVTWYLSRTCKYQNFPPCYLSCLRQLSTWLNKAGTKQITDFGQVMGTYAQTYKNMIFLEMNNANFETLYLWKIKKKFCVQSSLSCLISIGKNFQKACNWSEFDRNGKEIQIINSEISHWNGIFATKKTVNIRYQI